MPLYLRLPLLPVFFVEALLRKLANQLTAAGFPSLTPPKQRGRKGGGRGGGGGRPMPKEGGGAAADSWMPWMRAAKAAGMSV